MTALDKFERLESGGLWREHSAAQRRDVIVSFGKTTLVLSDPAGRPLAHWSLPAVQRQNVGQRPAIYAPDPDASETLEIEDEMMVDAIEQVRKALITSMPQPGKLRGRLTAAILIAVLALAVFWAPGAFTQKTLSVVPASKRTEFGATILGHVQRLTGPTCRGGEGTAALAKLHDRLFGAGSTGQIVVVPDLAQGAAALPGGIVMIDRTLVEQYDDPAIAAGYILAAAAGGRTPDRLAHLLDLAGLRSTMTLFTTGDLPDSILQAYAAVVQQTPQIETAPDTLRAAFDAAKLPAAPFLDARDASPETRAAFTGLTVRGVANPVLKDGDWVRLQGICTL